MSDITSSKRGRTCGIAPLLHLIIINNNIITKNHRGVLTLYLFRLVLCTRPKLNDERPQIIDQKGLFARNRRKWMQENELEEKSRNFFRRQAAASVRTSTTTTTLTTTTFTSAATSTSAAPAEESTKAFLRFIFLMQRQIKALQSSVAFGLSPILLGGCMEGQSYSPRFDSCQMAPRGMSCGGGGTVVWVTTLITATQVRVMLLDYKESEGWALGL